MSTNKPCCNQSSTVRPVFNILAWNNKNLKKNILSQGYITGFDMNFAVIYKNKLYFQQSTNVV